MNRILFCLLILVAVFYLTACDSFSFLQPTPTETPNLSLEQCAIQLVEEKYHLEQSSDVKISSTTADQVRMEVWAYNSCDSIDSVKEYCRPGHETIMGSALYVDVLIESSGPQCKVMEDHSFSEDCIWACPTPTSPSKSTTSQTPTPSPTPECIGDAWSYAENVQTTIEINPDLKIQIGRTDPFILRDELIVIYGDGKVVFTAIDLGVEETIEKRIQKKQLQQIVSAFEEANFYAISVGCGGIVGIQPDAANLYISVETDGKSYDLDDLTACITHDFDNYCDLDDTIAEILGLPWW